MVEAPEALLIAAQLDETMKGRTITTVLAGHSPHKFAWYYGDPADYEKNLVGKTVDGVRALGGMVEMRAGDMTVLLAEGVNILYFAPGATLPKKHQLLIGFDDESALVVSVRMYGALMAMPDGGAECSFSQYYNGARTKPQVMSGDFTRGYFDTLLGDPAMQNKSAKAFLATEQRIPGLGNGVLQDILYNTRINPKTKLEKLTAQERDGIYPNIVSTLSEIYSHGGRNSETDIFGRNGQYIPFLSKDTVGRECPRCSDIIVKESYMGGSIYYCPTCQPYRK